MPRTTVDIDGPILRDLKRLQKKEGKTLGRLVSDLLATALHASPAEPAPPFQWIATDMGARIDLTDKDAIYGALDREALSRAADGDEQ